MFGLVVFTKPGAQIAKQAKIKSAAVSAKIKEREARIAKIMREYKISERALSEATRNMQATGQMSASNAYNIPVRPGRPGKARISSSVPAGVLTNITTERDLIVDEIAQVERLDLLARNVASAAEHKLTFDELDYLGF
jgi:hypothetical protein